MVQLYDGGAYVLNGTEIIPDTADAAKILAGKMGAVPSREEAKKQTIAYGILRSHNTSDNMEKLKIRFDKLTSHDITFVGIIQTARASGLTRFPMPYVLTNCHNKNMVESMCRLIRQSSISLPERCSQAVVR